MIISRGSCSQDWLLWFRITWYSFSTNVWQMPACHNTAYPLEDGIKIKWHSPSFWFSNSWGHLWEESATFNRRNLRNGLMSDSTVFSNEIKMCFTLSWEWGDEIFERNSNEYHEITFRSISMNEHEIAQSLDIIWLAVIKGFRGLRLSGTHKRSPLCYCMRHPRFLERNDKMLHISRCWGYVDHSALLSSKMLC